MVIINDQNMGGCIFVANLLSCFLEGLGLESVSDLGELFLGLFRGLLTGLLSLSGLLTRLIADGLIRSYSLLLITTIEDFADLQLIIM